MRLGFFLTVSFLSIHPAYAAASSWQKNPHGQVRLVSEYSTAPQNGSILLGLHFQPAPGWYLYWKIAGEAGIPPKVSWSGSQGIQDPVLLWPLPTRFMLPGDIVEYGYDGEMVYPVKAQIVGAGSTLHAVAHLSYLTCNTSCVPYKYTLTLDIPTGPVVKADPEIQPLLQRFLSQVPAPDKTDEQIKSLAPRVVKNPFPEESAPVSAPASRSIFLLFAFLGGIILNVMPCVLPVLSLKLAGLLQQTGQSRGLITRHALLSAAGIIVSFEVLAVIAVVARSAGHAVGWGIQFQSPVFVSFLAVVVFLFALNLWGVFEINLPGMLGQFAVDYGQSEGLMAYFTSGLFATLLATPCSAPFLGSAMGFALTQPPFTVIAAFTAAGVGMASPYFLLAVFPGSFKWLPRPGVWMIRLKALFGIFLAGTALWLGWVLVQQLRPVPQQAFDETQIQSHVAAGQPVLVDVTADWCVTCKYNERFVLNSSEVKEALQKRGVLLMRADWTTRNEVIRQYLAKFGRSGIPCYVYYAPGQSPVLLSEFLTRAKVLRVLQN